MKEIIKQKLSGADSTLHDAAHSLTSHMHIGADHVQQQIGNQVGHVAHYANQKVHAVTSRV